MIDITSDKLTPMENRIYKAIVFLGLNKKELAEKFCIEPNTVECHLSMICLKKQISGRNRYFGLVSEFWGKFMNDLNWNCSICEYNKGKCINQNSQFFNEKFSNKQKSENMVCGRFKGREKE